MRKTLAALAAILLVGVLATAAHAYVYKSGTKGCGGNSTPYVQSLAYGLIYHWPPGYGYYKASYGHSQWKSDRTYGTFGSGGGYWQVRSNGGIDDGGTYAGCKGGTP